MSAETYCNILQPALRVQCRAKTATGKPCPWRPEGADSLCLMHDPKRADERREMLRARGLRGLQAQQHAKEERAKTKVDTSAEIKPQGGARPGAGRKPKALRYAQEIAQAEGLIITALPDLIGALVKAAQKGDIGAARYLLDRVWGRVASQSAPIAEDIELPMDAKGAPSLAASLAAIAYAARIDRPGLKADRFKELSSMIKAASSDDPQAYSRWVKQRNQQNKKQEETEEDLRLQAALETALKKASREELNNLADHLRGEEPTEDELTDDDDEVADEA